MNKETLRKLIEDMPEDSTFTLLVFTKEGTQEEAKDIQQLISNKYENETRATIDNIWNERFRVTIGGYKKVVRRRSIS